MSGSPIISFPLLEIVDPGLLSTIQDLGRRGVGEMGVSPSGAADTLSARVANRLVGNPQDAALIETTLTGLHFKALQTTTIAVTGATAQLTVEGDDQAPWRSVRVRAGAEVKIGAAVSGLRSYIAFFGGIKVRRVLGSSSTDLSAGFGGIGRALARSDVLEREGDGELPERELSIRASARPSWRQPATLRVLPGPHFQRLRAQDLESLCAVAYRVSHQSNRQGLRLDGPPLSGHEGFDVLSSGVCAGCIQITSEGKPVVLLAEHQTTGGYAAPFTVITADLPDAAQLRPSDEVRFARATHADASVALSEKMQALSEALDEHSPTG